MKRVRIVFCTALLALTLALLLCGCSDGTLCRVIGHGEIAVAGYAATCTEDGRTDATACERCGSVVFGGEVISALGHTEAPLAAVAPTCTEKGLTEGVFCKVCNEVLVVQEEIERGHSVVYSSREESTCMARGSTGNGQCEACEYTVESEVLPFAEHRYEDYLCTVCGRFDRAFFKAGEYYREAFLNVEGGERLQKLYIAYEEARDFSHGYFADVYDLGVHVNSDDWFFVSTAYLYDHPEEYYMGISFSDTPVQAVTASGIKVYSIYLTTLEGEYLYEAEEIKEINKALRDLARKMDGLIGEETSEYAKAKICYEYILENYSYHYDESSRTSQTYNVHGAVLGDTIVCAGYSTILQFLLNYVGVECITVSGVTDNGDGHAWNLIRVDDGNWYWCDATWDDAYWNRGSLRYFCVSDTDVNFLKRHIPDRMEVLPERGKTAYSPK